MKLYALEAFIDDKWEIIRVSSGIQEVSNEYHWETRRYRADIKFRLMVYRFDELNFLNTHARSIEPVVPVDKHPSD